MRQQHDIPLWLPALALLLTAVLTGCWDQPATPPALSASADADSAPEPTPTSLPIPTPSVLQSQALQTCPATTPPGIDLVRAGNGTVINYSGVSSGAKEVIEIMDQSSRSRYTTTYANRMATIEVTETPFAVVVATDSPTVCRDAGGSVRLIRLRTELQARVQGITITSVATETYDPPKWVGEDLLGRAQYQVEGTYSFPATTIHRQAQTTVGGKPLEPEDSTTVEQARTLSVAGPTQIMLDIGSFDVFETFEEDSKTRTWRMRSAPGLLVKREQPEVVTELVDFHE